MRGLGYGEKQESGAGRLVCRYCGHETALTQDWIDGLRALALEMGCEDAELLARFLHRHVGLLRQGQAKVFHGLSVCHEPMAVLVACGIGRLSNPPRMDRGISETQSPHGPTC